MRKILCPISLMFVLLLSSCGGSSDKELSENEKHIQDSLSKIEQRKKADSLRKTNPLLIVPPDSTYTGDYTDKYPNGLVKFKGFYRFGERHGMWLSFYPTGIAWSEMHYDKGLRHGPNIAYYENGEIRYSGFYKNDEKDSVWSYYDTIGKIAEKVLFKDDKMVKKLPLQ